MVTKLAHGAAPKLHGASDKYAALDQKDAPRQFSQNFGDFVTTCLLTDPKQVSLEHPMQIIDALYVILKAGQAPDGITLGLGLEINL